MKKEKMEHYRSQTYKQLQALNLLDIVIVSKRKRTSHSMESMLIPFPLSRVSKGKW